jgi:hypothetical protein
MKITHYKTTEASVVWHPGRFSFSISFFSVSNIPQILQTHIALIYGQRYVTLSTDSAVKQNALKICLLLEDLLQQEYKYSEHV